jgi:hypothetical protein
VNLCLVTSVSCMNLCLSTSLSLSKITAGTSPPVRMTPNH